MTEAEWIQREYPEDVKRLRDWTAAECMECPVERLIEAWGEFSGEWDASWLVVDDGTFRGFTGWLLRRYWRPQCP